MSRRDLAQTWSRRRFVSAAGLAVMAVVLPMDGARTGHAQTDRFQDLRAKTGARRLRGQSQSATTIWGYDGAVPGPAIRVARGAEVRVRLINELPEPTLIHWHGVRLPNAMDGAPHLTQKPVEPGQSFDYRFTARDAGTYWYHASYSSDQQRGLYGALLIDEAEPVDVDSEVLLVLDEWQVNDERALQDANVQRDTAPTRVELAANNDGDFAVPVRRNDRIRIRVVNAARTRAIPMRVPDRTVWVMALDGQPAEPFVARDGRVVLAPGNRIDLFVDVTEDADGVPLMLVERGRDSVPIARLVIDPAASRGDRRSDPRPLPPNPLPLRIDLKNALRIAIPLDGAAPILTSKKPSRRSSENTRAVIAPGMDFWTASTPASPARSTPPLFSVDRDRAVSIAFTNPTASAQTIHVHGHHFRLLDNLDDGWKPFWLDTLLVTPGQTARIAFVADNPGKWTIHRQSLGSREFGMAAWFEVNEVAR